MTASPQIVGMVGLGHMGLPMAIRLHGAGYQVLVYDALPMAVVAAKEHGLRPAESLAALAASTDVVITSLPNGMAVAQVVGVGDGHDDSLLAGRTEGLFVVDTSSCSPSETRHLGQEMGRVGAVLVDAPVSGGVGRARTGELAIMVGGARHAIDHVAALLHVIGRAVITTGDLGTAHAMKALNNYVSATTLAATIEALIIGTATGLDARTMVDIINHSTSRSHSSEVKLDRFVLSRSFDAGFSIDLMAKDLTNAAAVAADAGLHPVFLPGTVAAWLSAARHLPDSADHTAVTVWLEEAVGATLS